ncbi:hypothetical protein [Poseidonibacter lekithochrous]|uniref:hypothetical protein n=1 Tax=Poseidonibacter lekithochrous TaxID=1904463 RepID=UPI000D39E83E|nr:hypothetical protein [Poseidonibacter lekithochrous]
MSKIKPYSNAGVDGSGGYEFQKHCALYIFLEKYENIKDSKYFICLEHHEDFLFCYLDESELLKNIDTYQAKKSTKNWALNDDFKDIIKKILQVGIDLKNDPTPKTNNYIHNLHFLTNQKITLKDKKIINTISDRDTKKKYSNLYQEVKQKLLTYTDNNTVKEINNLVFSYIDLVNSPNSNFERLIGKFNILFGNTILDHKASVETLLSLFRNVENTLNKGNIVKLMDKSKRVESAKINQTLTVLTTKQKAFNEWRELKDKYAELLKIPIREHSSFELEFKNAFDYFKDLEQVEHQKIKNFVKDIDLSECFTQESGLKKVIEEFEYKHNTQFNNISIKAILLASYIQTREEN